MRKDSRLSRMLHVLIHMGRHEERATSETIAQMLGTNPVVVRRTLGLLKEKGYVRSEKGHQGGQEVGIRHLPRAHLAGRWCRHSACELPVGRGVSHRPGSCPSDGDHRVSGHGETHASGRDGISMKFNVLGVPERHT